MWRDNDCRRRPRQGGPDSSLSPLATDVSLDAPWQPERYANINNNNRSSGSRSAQRNAALAVTAQAFIISRSSQPDTGYNKSLWETRERSESSSSCSRFKLRHCHCPHYNHLHYRDRDSHPHCLYHLSTTQHFMTVTIIITINHNHHLLLFLFFLAFFINGSICSSSFSQTTVVHHHHDHHHHRLEALSLFSRAQWEEECLDGGNTWLSGDFSSISRAWRAEHTALECWKTQ